MPDVNKLETLSNAGYRILPTCGTCKYANIRGGGWGTCQLQHYQHGKHTEIRKVSIHAAGSCNKFQLDEVTLTNLKVSGFDIFLSDESAS